MSTKSKARIPQITIGADYFRTTVRKESSYPLVWRWVKETLQNSYDAGASKFILNFYEDELCVEAIDNGYGMDEDTLLDVFLSVGGSKKDTEEGCVPIGGFGDAKKIVCFCWDRWEIHTLDNYLNNELIGNRLEKRKAIDGTRIKVYMGDEFNIEYAYEYLSLCQLDINIEFNILQNNTIVRTMKVEKLRRNKLVNDLGFARLYVNKSKPTEKLIVRLEGLALFTESIDGVKATCVLELNSAVDPKSKEYMLNVTREQLTWKYRAQVHAIITELLSNPNKALKPKREDRVVIMKGTGLCHSVSNSEYANNNIETVKIAIAVSSYVDRFKEEPGFDEFINEVGENKSLLINVPNTESGKVKEYLSVINFEDFKELFVGTDNTKMVSTINALKTPVLIDIIDDEDKNPLQQVFPYDIIIKGTTKKRYYGAKYQRFLLAWHKIIQYVCYYNTWNGNTVDIGNYKVGFVFDDDVLAQRCVIDGVPCYLLNPMDLNFQDYSWRGIVMELIDRATHEIAHHFEQDHNGNFIMIWNRLKSYMYMYIDDVMYSIGLIIKSTQKDLISNANLNEVFDYS